MKANKNNKSKEKKKISVQGDHNLSESKNKAERTLQAKAIIYNHL